MNACRFELMPGGHLCGRCGRTWEHEDHLEGFQTPAGADQRTVPAGPAHECRFAAYHGYCVECGADGWTPEERRRIRALQSAVRRG